MSTALPPKPRTLNQKSSIFIVASKYNENYTDALVENTTDELKELISGARVTVIRVPGAFEIPVTVETILRQEQQPSCVITLGLIIRGQTAHGDMVAESVTNTLQQIAVNYAIPVIHEVVLVSDDKQAYARCIGSELNRGREAARAAASILDTFQQLKRPSKKAPTPRNA
ncbi:MAG: 6,7-dimethyl-8-ribityllumazine synthase [Akkermansiaceae bacterium]